MAQVSYGTITITDTNDIERIYTVYAKSANNTTVPTAAAANWKESISEAPGTGNYIWQRTVVQKSGTQEKTYSDPVCLTGEEGTDGRGITSITIKYGTSTDWNTQPSSWYDNTPEYSSSTPNYWIQTTISYTTGNPTVKVTQDKALTQAIYDSIMANSLAQSANENANGAMGQAASNVNSIVRLWRAKSERSIPSAPTTEITTGSTSEYTNWSTVKPTATDTYRYFYYCDQSKTGGGVCTWSEVIEDTSYLSTYEINSLNVRTKNFFKGLDNSYDGWFASGRAENEGLATNNAETYHYNARFAATHIALGYNKTPIIDLDGGSGAINIYRFPTINSNTGLVTTAGALGMKLSATDLIFYKPPVGNNSPVAAATLNANGLVLSEGGIKAGTSRTNGFIYLSSANFADTISGHSAGTVSLDNYTATDWRQLIGTKFGVRADGTLYASNAVISGTITVGSGSTIDSGATIGGTSASTVVTNAATGAQASSDLSSFQTTVANTYATQSALSDVEGQIPSDINELSDTDGIIPNDLSQLTDTTNIISDAVSTGVAGKADKTEAVYRTQRIYRRYTAAQSSLNGPTTWVTNNTDIYNDWTTKIPPLTNNGTKYPYLYTCTQKQTVTQYNSGSGTECISTTVLLDDTTTIIDGGSIIAGSVTANEITGSKLSAIYADMGNITAGNITKGYNSINFDNSPATLEFKNNSTWANATKGIQWTGSDLNIKGNITASSLTIGSGATVSGLSTSNINGINDYALQSSLDTEVAERKAVYAISTTGATTSAKTTESGTPSGFVLYNGATVTVKFNSANSTTTPTLNVNGTGAKTIKSYTGAALSAAEYTWPVGAAITFTYDGSYWRMQDSGALQAKADAAESASAASTQASAASTSATNASNAKTAAESAKTAAQTAQGAAESAKTAAQTAQSAAETASGQATTAKNDAVSAKTAAQAAQTAAETAQGQAQTAASNASQSETNAAASATAAAEVMGGFTILWNYSAFGTSTAGDAFICGFDSATGTKSDANGWVKWNGTKRTITKQQVNPGTIVPYNIPIYIVCRLSSATSTTGTNYMVWYNSGWKYAACPSPTTVGGSWTWTDNRDIILGSFVETGADEVLTECELFNPPWTSKQITTNTTTPTSYIMDTDSNRGITVKPKDSSGNNFLQMNSTAIEFFKNSTTASAMRLTDDSFRLGLEASNHTTIDTNGLHIWTGTEDTATNEVALFSSTARIGKTNSSRFLLNADSLQAYNSSNQLYFEVSDEELKTSLTEAKDVFTVGYGSAIANKTETRILNSTSGVLDLTAIPFNTNFNLTFTVFFVGYSVTLGQSTTFENKKLSPSDGFAWNSIQAAVWREAAGYSGELLPSGSMEIGIGQSTPGEKQINYNITITGTGLTFDYATITAVWEESAAVKDQVFLTFGSREDGISKGLFSSAMGLKVAAIGDYSHAEGYHTIASGNYSHASGFGTQAIGDYSYSSGYGTKATIDYQTVFGKYNLEDSEAMFIVGNGADDNNRSNLMTIGNNYIRIGNNSEGSNNIQISPDGLTISHGVSSIFNVGEADSTELGYTTETFNQTITGSDSDTTVTIQLGIEQTPPVGSTITLNRNYDLINSGGDSSSSSSSSSSSGGSGSSGTGSSSGSGSGQARPGVGQIPYEHYTAGTSATTTHNGCTVVYDGAYTFTITVNSGYYFNLYNIKYANTSTAGGKLTLGSRINTPEPITISGSTREDGFNSTALGTGLQAYTPNQLVIGKYNKGDSTNAVSVKHAFIIGNGSINSTGEITESNALTVDWDGNIVIPNYSSYGAIDGNGYVKRLCYITSANNCIFGYDGYDSQDGDSFLYGNNVYIRTAAGYIYPNTRIVMPNNVSIRAKTANGNNDYQLIFASDSNNIVVGSSSWNDCYIHRVYSSGTGTVSTVPNVRILDNSRLTRTTHANSSIKIKHDIKDIENKELDPHRLYGVEVKQFIYNDDVITDKNDCRYHKEIAGFIAEQLHECYPIAVDINEKGECEAWQAQYIIPPMLKLIQEQHEEIEQLKKEVAELKNK